MSWLLSRPSRLLCLLLGLLGGLFAGGPAPTAANSQELPPLAVTRKVSQLTCTVTEPGPVASVTLELSYETHARTRYPEDLQPTVGELRRWLEQPRKKTMLRDFQTASWRIARTSFAPDTFFGEHTQSVCSAGCALHEVSSIDMKSSAFVAAPATGAELRTDLEFSGLDSLYGAASRAVISYIGFGEYHGFVVELPGGLPQTKASCH